jgi:hypothetical protein
MAPRRASRCISCEPMVCVGKVVFSKDPRYMAVITPLYS